MDPEPTRAATVPVGASAVRPGERRRVRVSIPPPASCELTILMPCLDEAETLPSCIAKGRRFLRLRGIEGEVLVADNGSTDGSRELARSHGARVVTEPRKGYGRALRTGIEAARGRYVVIGDADDSYDFSDLDPFVEKLREGFDLVMGNRFRGGIAPGAMPPTHRYLGNPVLSLLGRLFFRSPVGDFHCGLRGFRRKTVEGLQLAADGMEFASEMVVKATLAGLRITEVPTTLSPDGRSRPPHLRSWRDGWRHLRFLLLFSPRWLFLYPGVFLLLAGLACMLWLTPASRTVGSVGFDVNTLVYSGAAIVCGFQLVAFSVFGRLFAEDAGILPPDPAVRRLRHIFRLEVGLGLGVFLALVGVVASTYAVGMWGRASFGPLDPRASLRLVVPSAVALILGVQIAFSGFFMSLLSLGGGHGSEDRGR